MGNGIDLIEGAAMIVLWLCGASTGALLIYQVMRSGRR